MAAARGAAGTLRLTTSLVSATLTAAAGAVLDCVGVDRAASITDARSPHSRGRARSLAAAAASAEDAVVIVLQGPPSEGARASAAILAAGLNQSMAHIAVTQIDMREAQLQESSSEH
eukprot:1588401-Pleurochrysis_carterae.AAC.1